MAVLPFRLASVDNSRMLNAFEMAVTAENPRCTIVCTV